MTQAFELKEFCVLGVQPAEDLDAFEELLSELDADLKPSGILQQDIVETIAALVWRRQNPEIFRYAARLYKHYGTKFEIPDPLLRKVTIREYLAALEREESTPYAIEPTCSKLHVPSQLTKRSVHHRLQQPLRM